MTYMYVNEHQIDIELKCTICDEPFQSPMNCQFCGYTYCPQCIVKWLTEQSLCPSCREDLREHLIKCRRMDIDSDGHFQNIFVFDPEEND